PEDIDEEVRGLMRRAYEENTAPPAPRRPARRPGAVAGTMTVVIEGSELPGRTCRPEPAEQGHQDVYVALGGRSEDRPALTMSNKPGMAIEPVPAEVPAARWEMPVTVRRDEDGFDFGGPFVRGVRDDRHLGLIWGDRVDRGGPAGRADSGREALARGGGGPGHVHAEADHRLEQGLRPGGRSGGEVGLGVLAGQARPQVPCAGVGRRPGRACRRA